MFGKAFKATFGVGCALVVGTIALIVIAGALGSSARPDTTSPTTAPIGVSTNAPAGAPKSWVAIKDWTGNGTKQTETFTVGNEDINVTLSVGPPLHFSQLTRTDGRVVGLPLFILSAFVATTRLRLETSIMSRFPSGPGSSTLVNAWMYVETL